MGPRLTSEICRALVDLGRPDVLKVAFDQAIRSYTVTCEMLHWLASERARKSVIPMLFWYFSIGGGATLFAYAIYREDPVFIVGQGAGLGIYLRNLWLTRREKRAMADV